MGRKGLHILLIGAPQGHGGLPQLRVAGLRAVPVGTSGGQGAAEVLPRHGGSTAHQIPQVVGQICIDGLDQKLVGEIAVGPKGKGAHQEETQSVHAKLFGQNIGVHHIALGLAHLASVQQQPAVAEALFGKRLAQAHQNGRPDNGVEADNLLAHNVYAGPPALAVVAVPVVLIAQGSDIVGEGVHPDVDHMSGVKIHGHAPGKARP